MMMMIIVINSTKRLIIIIIIKSRRGTDRQQTGNDGLRFICAVVVVKIFLELENQRESKEGRKRKRRS